MLPKILYHSRLPGLNMIYVNSAEDTKIMYDNDYQYPSNPFFELTERIRVNQLSHLFSTPGEESNQ